MSINYLATAGGAKKSLIDFGSGWLSFKDRILSDPGTPGHIADSREIMKATMPGGPLTPAGGDDLDIEESHELAKRQYPENQELT